MNRLEHSRHILARAEEARGSADFGKTHHTMNPAPSNTSALAVQPRLTSHEMAASASAALAKATIEAKFVVAMQRPRSVMNARAAILDACNRRRFAEGAWYKIPNRGEGFTIRFAEQALSAWRNVDVASVTAWEDEERRLVRITVTDLESNLSFADEVLLEKTVERSFVKAGQTVISTRENTDKKKVYLVECTEDELLLKVNAAKSRVIRNSGLRLIPQDILEEAEEAIRTTMRSGGENTSLAVAKLRDAFNALNVPPAELEAYLGHPLATTTADELNSLRGVYSAIRDGEATWKDYNQPKQADTPKPADEIPGAEAPPPTIAGTHVVGDSREQLAELVNKAGFTFDDLVKWGTASGNINDADSLTCYAEVPPETAARLLRAKAGLLKALAAAKVVAR